MSERVRMIILAATGVLVLAVANYEIAAKESLIRNGTTVLLRLAPVDPRSLIQGDYMALRYAMTREVAGAADVEGVSDGVAIVELGERNEASFVAIQASQHQPQGNQLLLRFRKRGESVRLASDAFFFEEGEMDTYSGARYGELRVNAQGEAVLTGLRDTEGQPMGERLHQYD